MDFNDTRFVDLHIHSTASDGSLPPVEILTASEKAGLSAIAITDHDTIEGCRDILDTARAWPLDCLTGVEISAAFPEEFSLPGSLHILGYDFDINDSRLNQRLKKQEAARNQRSPEIIQRLNGLGLDLSIEDVKPFAQGTQLGRPHIASAMKALGMVNSIDEAFDRYIGSGGPAYVDKPRIKAEHAIDLINAAGGVSVLAHPGLINTRNEEELKQLISLMTNMGLKGIEALYPDHSSSQTAYYKELADRYNLLITGGSDFHGALNPHIQLGKGKGDLFVSYALFERLIACSRAPVYTSSANCHEHPKA